MDLSAAVASWPSFVAELQEQILPIYAAHEQHFDGAGIHGRMHICRAVLFAEYMARCYAGALALDVDLEAIRLAVACHDAGREGNGIDLWEHDSAERCRRSLEQAGAAPSRAQYVGGLILKRGPWDLARRVVHDADVLEIMRPCCGHGGLAGFRRGRLRFLGSRDPEAGRVRGAGEQREALVLEAWRWIEWTEGINAELRGARGYMAGLLRRLAEARARFPLLATVV